MVNLSILKFDCEYRSAEHITSHVALVDSFEIIGIRIYVAYTHRVYNNSMLIPHPLMGPIVTMTISIYSIYIIIYIAMVVTAKKYMRLNPSFLDTFHMFISFLFGFM